MTPTPSIEKAQTRRVLTVGMGRTTKAQFEAEKRKATVVSAPIAGTIVPSSPTIFALRTLRRAPENVRHTRSDEDIVGLADDIAAHGLLQSLIGYKDDDGRIQIVGGGRRFQALRELEDRGAINGDFPVAVLIRAIEDAVELSLAENLQQRTMSPVDEFFAFKTLMERGDTSPAELAKRFGWKERTVKQRLRLAELATPVLDALSAREISLDAAMAYASSSDRDLQAEVFKTEKRRGRDAQDTGRIRHALALKTYATDHPLYRFVGADAYEARGGTYEDDLFNEAGKERRLAQPFLLETIAREQLERGYGQQLAEWVCSLAPTITGFVIPADLRIKSYGNDVPKAPPGFEAVERYDHAPLWKTIRNNAIETKVLIGVNDAGELAVWPKTVFVPKDQRRAIEAGKPASPGSAETQEQRDARVRRQEVDRWARRLAVGPFAGTFLQDRVFWPAAHEDRSVAFAHDTLGNGWLVSAKIFVPDDAIVAHRGAAEAKLDAEDGARDAKVKADEARLAELEAMDPPAIVVLDGMAWARGDDGSYQPVDPDDHETLPSWDDIVDNFDLDEIGATFATREAFDVAMDTARAEDLS